MIPPNGLLDVELDLSFSMQVNVIWPELIYFVV